jgi:DNA polymerase-3 subunit alpha
MNGGFVHLHVHTEYSLLEGMCRIDELVERTRELGMTAVAMTDSGAMYGAIHFYKKALAAGVKPILGCEVFVAKRSLEDRPTRGEEPDRLVLLAESLTGYRNLLKIVSSAQVDGFYFDKPLTDKETLFRHREGLIALSAGPEGEIGQLIMQGDFAGAERAAREYAQLFGGERFYLELHDHGVLEEKQLLQQTVQLARRLNLPVVATNNVHYLQAEDAAAQDVLACIREGRTIQEQDRRKLPTGEFYLKSPEEMESLFGWMPEALENARRIAERCQVVLPLGEMHLPAFDLPEGFTEISYLQHLCERGAYERYGQPGEEVWERLKYELEVIGNLGFAGYFLIVWDFMRFAHEQGISTGPGRGSAAGSLVSYVLRITDVDPIRLNLLFQRFLNPERVSWPDIDIDFEYERRQEVIDYVTRKYGADRVAQIVTFGTMAARAAIRDVGRVLGFPPAVVDRAAKAVPHYPGATLQKAMAEETFRQLYETDAQVRQLVDAARAIEGLPRHTSLHAAGVVISQEPLTEYVPLMRGAEGGIVTQYAMDVLEDVGLLKMDFLGLRYLSLIDQTVETVRQTEGLEICFERMGMDDRRTFELLCRGDTDGCFQLESSGVKHVLRDLRPSSFEDIIAVISLYRPGPMENIPTFIKAKHGEIPVTYPHPDLRGILEDTYGVIVYQEQIMQIASTMAGFSLGQADLLRRAVGKKKRDVLDEQRAIFVKGCLEKGYEERLAHEVYDLIVRFADYGFNRAHAAAYAVLAYRTCYLKANHPAAYMAALLTSVMMSSTKVAQYVDDCRRMGIEVLPPDVNRSSYRFTVEDGKVRFGLLAVKNVGTAALKALIQERRKGAFRDLRDFCERVDARACNKKAIESLIRSGCFDSLHGNRKAMMLALEETAEQGRLRQKELEDHQMNLFGFMAEGQPREERGFVLPQVGDYPERERLEMEKELIGLYLTGSPLTPYRAAIERVADRRISELVETPDNAVVTIAGMVRNVKTIQTKKGARMAFLIVEDTTGLVEVVLFPEAYKRCQWLLGAEEAVLAVKGRLQHREEEVKVIADRVLPLQTEELEAEASERQREAALPVHEHGHRVVYLRVRPEDEGKLVALQGVLAAHRGTVPVRLYYTATKKVRALSDKYAVRVTEEFVRAAEALLGEGAVAEKHQRPSSL